MKGIVMDISTLNKLFGLFIMLIVFFYIFYPDYYEENLKKNIFAEKEAEMLEISKELCLKLEEQNIIARIREEQQQEIKKKIETKSSNNIIEYFESINVNQLLNIIANPFDVVIWDIKNIDIANLRAMPVEDKEAYLDKNAEFKPIVSNSDYKYSFSIIKGDEYHKLLRNAILTNGQKVLTISNKRNNFLVVSAMLLNPIKAQKICMFIDDWNWREYNYSNMIDLYSYMKIILVILIIIIPVLYIIFDHRIKAKSLDQEDLYLINKEWTPSIWQITVNSPIGYVILALYTVMIIPLIIIFAYTIKEFGYSNNNALLAIASLSLFAIALLALPVLLKTIKVRRLFRIGKEIDCIFTEELHTGDSRLQTVYNVYSYIFNGKTYSAKEIQPDNQKRLIAGKTKLTVLVDPAKPKRAIVKDNYLPNAHFKKYTTDCFHCGAAVEQGEIEKDNILCSNCDQILNAAEKDAECFYSNFKSYKFVCTECKTKLVLDESESTVDYISIYCPDCNWSTAIEGNTKIDS
jgi:hypothetical protein